jgi:DNA-binding ferritin-like protein
MQDIAITLKCLRDCTHIAHNLAQGPSFFADHLALGEFYAAHDAAYDSVVERLIAMWPGCDLFVIATEADAMLQAQPHTVGEMWGGILSLEKELCNNIEITLGKMGGFSMGTVNLLAGIADASEVRQYKIQQRLKP